MPYARHTTRPPKPKTRARRRAEAAMYDAFSFLRKTDVIERVIREEVPDEWHLLELDYDVTEKKEKVTLYLDRSVARCFKAMGKGYQERINALLRAWMQMKISEFMYTEEKLLERAEFLVDYMKREAEAREARMGAYTAEGLGWTPPKEAG